MILTLTSHGAAIKSPDYHQREFVTALTAEAASLRWSARADGDLTVYLDAALSALSAGFDTTAMESPEQCLDGMPAPGI
jgi:hypothetical protein